MLRFSDAHHYDRILHVLCIKAYLAWRFNFHPALGEPLIGSLYAPWQWAV